MSRAKDCWHPAHRSAVATRTVRRTASSLALGAPSQVMSARARDLAILRKLEEP